MKPCPRKPIRARHKRRRRVDTSTHNTKNWKHQRKDKCQYKTIELEK